MENKAEYIDRRDLLRRLPQDLPYKAKGCRNCYYDRAISAIENAPTVNAVEVVRCKDCKHWHADAAWCYHHSHFIDDEGGACHPWESPTWKMFDENDYCSYGERKVGKDDNL